jgi:hypothetical protein
LAGLPAKAALFVAFQELVVLLVHVGVGVEVGEVHVVVGCGGGRGGEAEVQHLGLCVDVCGDVVGLGVVTWLRDGCGSSLFVEYVVVWSFKFK